MTSPSPPEGDSEPGLAGARLVTAVVEKMAARFTEVLVTISARASSRIGENAVEEELARFKMLVNEAAAASEVDDVLREVWVEEDDTLILRLTKGVVCVEATAGLDVKTMTAGENSENSFGWV